MTIENIKALINKVLQAQASQAAPLPSAFPVAEEGTLDYQQLLQDYAHLTALPELSEIEAKHLDRILWLAESDDLLSLLIEEFDEFSLQTLEYSEPEAWQHLQRQTTKVEDILARMQAEEHQENPPAPSLTSLGKPFAVYRPVLQDYRRLTSQSALSEIEEKRLERILRSAESDDLLNILLDQVETVMLEAEQHSASLKGRHSASWKNRRTQPRQGSRALLPWLQLGVGALLLAIGTYHVRFHGRTAADNINFATTEIKEANTVPASNALRAVSANSSPTTNTNNNEPNRDALLENIQADRFALDRKTVISTMDSVADIDSLIQDYDSHIPTNTGIAQETETGADIDGEAIEHFAFEDEREDERFILNHDDSLSDSLADPESTEADTDEIIRNTVTATDLESETVNDGIGDRVEPGKSSGKNRETLDIEGTIEVGGGYLEDGTVSSPNLASPQDSQVVQANPEVNDDSGQIVWAGEIAEFQADVNAVADKNQLSPGFVEVSNQEGISFDGPANMTASQAKQDTVPANPENTGSNDAALTNAGMLRLVTPNARQGGSITLTGNNDSLSAPDSGSGESIILEASGNIETGNLVSNTSISHNGTILLGSAYQGSGSLTRAGITFVREDSIVRASALFQDNGRQVVVWTNPSRHFEGRINTPSVQTTGDLELKPADDGALVFATTPGRGQAGNLSVSTSEKVEVVGNGTLDDRHFRSRFFSAHSDNGSSNTDRPTGVNSRLQSLGSLPPIGHLPPNGTVLLAHAQSDSNSFHNFQDFNIEPGRAIYFANPALVQNIFNRVTGNNSSQLFGTLGVSGEASLFFLNPNSILFGPNVQTLPRESIWTSRLTVNGTGTQNAGNLNIDASERVDLSGFFVDNNNPTDLGSPIRGTGNIGSLTVNTKHLTVRDGGPISVTVGPTEQRGIITINAVETIDPIGTTSETLHASENIYLHTPRIPTREGGVISASTLHSAQGGNIKINTQHLTVREGANIAVNSQFRNSDASNINIAGQPILLDRGSIVAETVSGEGGNIGIRVQDLLLLRHGSRIATTAGTAQAGGNGGNITIDAGFVVAVPGENSDITANVFTGNGGNIRIRTNGIFGLGFRPRLTPLSDITASSEFGVDGTFTLDLLVPTDIRYPLANLPQEPKVRELDRGCYDKDGHKQSNIARGSLQPYALGHGAAVLHDVGRGGMVAGSEKPLEGNVLEWSGLAIERKEALSLRSPCRVRSRNLQDG